MDLSVNFSVVKDWGLSNSCLMMAYYFAMISLKTKLKLGVHCVFDITKKKIIPLSIVHGKTESTKAVYYPTAADISENLDRTNKPSLNCLTKYYL